jgi:outer membrane protein OmpA-like peptidoglycan-associated protein
MRRIFLMSAMPLTALILAGCTQPQQADKAYNNAGANKGDANVTASTPGYVALQQGDNRTAVRDFKASAQKTPNSAFDELDLGAAYQRQGRMDLALPLYRQAMTHGHGVEAASTTDPQDKGKTVEQIACRDLSMALTPAQVARRTSSCQTTLVIAVAAGHKPAPFLYQTSAYNTYFDFDAATLTPAGRDIVASAARDARRHPNRHVTVIGNTGKVGPSGDMELSQRRADSIRAMMIEDGVRASKIDVQWVQGNDA